MEARLTRGHADEAALVEAGDREAEMGSSPRQQILHPADEEVSLLAAVM